MYRDKKIVAIIPARGGSKTIPRKNVKHIAGKPLVAHSIEHALHSKYVDYTYVSTEDSEIVEISKKHGALIINRPEEHATDTASTESVLLHAAEVLNWNFDYMVLLQPTSPIRTPEHIDEAIKLLIDSGGDSLLSGYENNVFYWLKSGKPLNYDYRARPRRQDKEWEFVENGSIYITSKEVLRAEKNRLGGKIILYEMPRWMSFEIDTPFDFELVEYLMKRFRPNLNEKIRKVKLIIFNVDGIFTDGSVFLDEDGKESQRFSRIDGKGIELVKKAGLKTAVISSEESQVIKHRMEKLKIDHVFTGIKDKLSVYNTLKHKYGLKDEEICFCGDDVQDLDLIKVAGLGCCPQNAQEPVKKIADHISNYRGGEGFVREVCNLFLDPAVRDPKK